MPWESSLLQEPPDTWKVELHEKCMFKNNNRLFDIVLGGTFTTWQLWNAARLGIKWAWMLVAQHKAADIFLFVCLWDFGLHCIISKVGWAKDLSRALMVSSTQFVIHCLIRFVWYTSYAYAVILILKSQLSNWVYVTHFILEVAGCSILTLLIQVPPISRLLPSLRWK